MSTREVVVAGRALHSGEPARVVVRADPDAEEVRLCGSSLSEWRPARAERSTAIARGEARLRTVEHLFAALAGLGWRRGLSIDVEGTELPIVDGCAAAWMSALRPLGLSASRAPVRIAREGVVDVGASRYAFAPGEGTRVAVELELGDPRLAREARWEGDVADFQVRIAPARTFCFAGELEELARQGLASHVTPEMVVVIGDEILAAGRPFEPDEPARHKLLDVVGDLFVHGGPFRGRVHAYRPGHWTTHEAVRMATQAGLLVRDR